MMKHVLYTENKDCGLQERSNISEAEDSELRQNFICVLKDGWFRYAEGIMV